MPFGTIDSSDTLATLLATNASVVEFGEDNLYGELAKLTDFHNEIVNELLGNFIEKSTDRLRRYGSVDTMIMEELDEYGTPDAQKMAVPGTNVGFPLRRVGVTVQWTRTFLQNASVAELAKHFAAATAADIRRLTYEIKRALFLPTNVTFYDFLTDSVELPIKRLVNADSAVIPMGPSGATFNGATHTHYLARVGALAASDITAVISTVQEHHASGELLLYINQASEAAVRGFTSNFTPYIDARLIPAQNTVQLRGSLDTHNTWDRAIGIFDSAEVWVKPWIPANYMFAWVDGAPVPLVMRTRAGGGAFGLAFEDERYPLRARGMEREYGLGVWTRTNGAVLYTGGTTYTAPTLTV